MKVYISGKITGDPDYKEKFERVEKKLLECGYIPVNPIKVSPYDENKIWSDYMKEDIKAMMDCDAIYMIADWFTSKGARVEHTLAEILEIKIIYEE